jgi:release factor glutamine methyltransferase
MKLSTAIELASSQFEKAGIESFQADAEILLSYVLDISRGELQVKAITGEDLAQNQEQKFMELVEKRSERFPLQHLTGVAYFRQLELLVGPGVFVPRFETESVSQLAIDALRLVPADNPIAVDLATGSGAIALSIATEVPNSKVFAIELSEEALVYTKRNFAKYAPTATLVQGDLVDAFPELDGQVDVLVSNPPYIPDDMIPIYPEVHLHDPSMALYGGSDGLDLVRKVELAAKRLLRKGGALVIEHADMQGESIRQLILSLGWRQCVTHKDLAGRDRATTAIR